MKKIKVLIIEDNNLFRTGIISMLEKQKDIDIISESGSNKYTIGRIRKLKPDIILLDLGLRNRNSLSVVESVKKDLPAVKVIVMDISPVQGDINQFIKAGASGFIIKDATFSELLITIRAAARGTYVPPTNLSGSLLSEIVDLALKGGKIKLKDAVRISKKEREVIRLIGDGFNNNEIGQKLHISTLKVNSYINNIMKKLSVYTRMDGIDLHSQAEP